MKKTFLIIFYNKSWFESDTLNSLIRSEVDFSECELVLWNNGPQINNSNDLAGIKSKFKQIITYQSQINFSLSRIYNYVIERHADDYLIILDHDTGLSDQYLTDVVAYSGASLAVPRVVLKNNNPQREELYNSFNLPTIYDSHHTTPLLPKARIETVGSGLVISRQLLDNIKNVYGDYFDPRFAFYCADLSFLTRISELAVANEVVFIREIYHSLSEFEQESAEKIAFRIKQKSIGRALLIREHYFLSFVKWKRLYKQLDKILTIGCSKTQSHSRFDLWVMLRYFFIGRHPNQVEIMDDLLCIDIV
ncbi:MAG: glycosyltransferase family 2 protein [Aeromonas sp.]